MKIPPKMRKIARICIVVKVSPKKATARMVLKTGMRWMKGPAILAPSMVTARFQKINASGRGKDRHIKDGYHRAGGDRHGLAGGGLQEIERQQKNNADDDDGGLIGERMEAYRIFLQVGRVLGPEDRRNKNKHIADIELQIVEGGEFTARDDQQETRRARS